MCYFATQCFDCELCVGQRTLPLNLATQFRRSWSHTDCSRIAGFIATRPRHVYLYFLSHTSHEVDWTTTSWLLQLDNITLEMTTSQNSKASLSFRATILSNKLLICPHKVQVHPHKPRLLTLGLNLGYCINKFYELKRWFSQDNGLSIKTTC